MKGTGTAGTRVARAARLAAATLLIAALILVVLANTARAINIYQDLFVSLSARPLAMGGAFTALSGPESVFVNPAGLAGVRNLRMVHNHSGRHFPGSTEGGMSEWDQLDGDTQVIAVPLPLLTYAHGFAFSGEMGYDYRGHPADGSLGYPREQYWGTESYDALASSFGLPVSAGISLRRHLGRFTPAEADQQSPGWIRLGEGTQWGILARVWPGLDYGYSELKMDYDWTINSVNELTNTISGRAEPEQSPGALPTMESRLKLKRSGWAIHPAGWLVLSMDDVTEQYIIRDEAFLGSLHQGNTENRSSRFGGELKLAPFGSVRWGNFDGHQTVGGSLNLGGVMVNYAEIEDFLPEIVGDGESFKNIHIYGFDVTF